MVPVEPHVLRYHEGADRFVEIRARAAEACAAPDAAFDERQARRRLLERYVVDLEGLTEREEHLVELQRLVLETHPELEAAEPETTGPAPARPRLDAIPGAARTPSESRAAPPAPPFRRRLRRLARAGEARLGRHLVGQGDAVRATARAVQRAALGWGVRGPLASLLFVGPTGVGKTELARALAAEISPTGDAADALIRIDGAELGERHEAARLLGAPPGYVGHGEPGILDRGLARNPCSVLLVDEVEKADARLHDLLLQILDEGSVTDGTGRRLDLSRTFLVLTSNAGSRELARAKCAVGFRSDAEAAPSAATRGELVRSALEARFRPEFLARLQEVVVFDELGPAEAREIARRALTDLATRVRRTGPRVRISRAVGPWLAEHGLAAGEGARGILHLLRRRVEAPLAEAALGLERGQWLSLAIRGGAPDVRPLAERGRRAS